MSSLKYFIFPFLIILCSSAHAENYQYIEIKVGKFIGYYCDDCEYPDGDTPFIIAIGSVKVWGPFEFGVEAAHRSNADLGKPFNGYEDEYHRNAFFLTGRYKFKVLELLTF